MWRSSCEIHCVSENESVDTVGLRRVKPKAVCAAMFTYKISFPHQIFKKDIFLLLYVCDDLTARMSVKHTIAVSPLGLELQAGVNCYVVAGNRPWVL